MSVGLSSFISRLLSFSACHLLILLFSSVFSHNMTLCQFLKQRHMTQLTNYTLHTPTSPLPPTGLDNESSQVILMPLTFPTFRNFITYTKVGAVSACKHQTTWDLDECSMVARWNSWWTINISLFDCRYKIIHQAHMIHTVNFINIFRTKLTYLHCQIYFCCQA